MELKGKVCLIAGGAGVIGAVVAKRFCQEGAELALTFRSKRPKRLPTARKTRSYLLDVCRWRQVEALVRQVERDFGKIDVLVNTTGTLGPIGPTHQVSVKSWEGAIRTNLVGCFYLARAVLPGMLSRGEGRIIFFSGGGAAYGRPFFTAYSASKAAVVRFTESLAEELRDTSICINAIAPGPVRSPMWDQLREAGAAAGPRALTELQEMEKSGGVLPDLAASLALFLASDRARGLTGRLISSVHDNWQTLEQRIPEVMSTDAGTLRRISWGARRC